VQWALIDVLQANTSSFVTEQELFTHFKAFSHNCSSFGPSQCHQRSCFSVWNSRTVFFIDVFTILTHCKISQKLKFEIMDNVTFDSMQLCSKHRMQVTDFIITLFVCCRFHYYSKSETQKLLQKLPQKNRKANCVLHKWRPEAQLSLCDSLGQLKCCQLRIITSGKDCSRWMTDHKSHSRSLKMALFDRA